MLAFIVLTIWVFVAAPYDTLRYETRTVLALTGVVFANIAVSNPNHNIDIHLRIESLAQKSMEP